MRTTLKFCSSFFVLSFILLSFGCNGAAVDGLGGFVPPSPAPAPTSGDSSAPAVAGTSNSVSNDKTFYVGIDSNKTAIAHVHLSTGYSSTCVIPQSTTTSQNLDCFIEVPEGTLRFNGLKLKINQPSTMCNAIGYYPYWYYNEETGIGPTSVKITTTKTILASGDVTWATSTDCTVGNDGNPGVFDHGCTTQSEMIQNYSDTTGTVGISCVYDRSGIANRHNCCLGDYQKSLKVVTHDLGLLTTTSETTVTAENWGGDVSNCVGGAGHGWPEKDDNNYPIGAIYGNPDYSKPNYKEIDIGAPVAVTNINAALTYQTNLPAANYFHPTDHTHAGVVLPATSTAPFYVNPIDDRSGSPMISGEANYIVDCLDPGHEIKHRMTLHVREWNSYADFLVYVATLGATVNPDRGGFETIGGACDGVAGPCDDFHDPDAFLYFDANGGSGAYGTTPATRVLNFPFDTYK